MGLQVKNCHWYFFVYVNVNTVKFSLYTVPSIENISQTWAVTDKSIVSEHIKG